jgi:hypothetical protein
MSQISILCRSIPLIVVCLSCAGSAAPEAKTSAPPASPPPAGRVFQSAIAVRDESVTAFLGRLAPGKHAPSTVSITFYDGAGSELETLSNLDVQGSSSGLVYAAPNMELPKIRQQNIQKAVSAKVKTETEVEPVYLGQAEGTISRFREGYREPQVSSVDGGGCPHCLAYFLCCCMEKTYGLRVNREALGCSRFAACKRPCEEIENFVPTPR